MTNVDLTEEGEWTEIIRPKNKWFDLHIKEIWQYRDLLLLFVRRDFITKHKQTILGPFWHVIQPIMTTAVFTIVFNRIANISTDGVPPILFYFSGITIFQFFSNCLTLTSNTFIANSAIFGKVYFPRLIMPLSSMLSALISFGIQMILFAIMYSYYLNKGVILHPNIWVLAIPVLLLIMAALGLGAGIIISSVTTKYRDLTFFVSFGVQLIMYISPVIYPVSAIPERFQKYVLYNPLTPILEGFKYSLLGSGTFNFQMLLYSIAVSIVVLFIGVLLFNRVEKTFIDTV